MKSKIKEKEKAIKLRRRGLSYREIIEKVPVAKSSLSLWLREVGLSKKQKQRLTKKKLEAALRGAKRKREQRLERSKLIRAEAEKEIGKITKRDLWMIGTALYWAEGSKQRTGSFSTRTSFCNSDALLVKVYLKWLKEICNISRKDIIFRIYIHTNASKRLEEVRKYWSRKTGFPINYFSKVSWKKHKPKTNRRNVGDDYYGLLSVIVKRSTDLNRKISGWIEGVYKNSTSIIGE